MLSCDDIVLQLLMLVFSKSDLSSNSWIIFFWLIFEVTCCTVTESDLLFTCV